MATKMNSNNEQQHVTPVGTAKFPYLVKPDTKFDERGFYKVDLILTAKEAGAIESAAKKLATKFKQEDVANNPSRKKWGLHLPLLEDIDSDGEETGHMVARFKQAALIRTRDGREIQKSILLFDSDGNRLSNINPYSGTKMSVAYTMSAYANATGKTYGVTFRLIAAQIIELVEGGSGMSAESLGFQKHSDGFVVQQDADDEEAITDHEEHEEQEASTSVPDLRLSKEEGTEEEIPF